MPNPFVYGEVVPASAFVAREADFHTMLNPQNMGYWGVRYKISWWLSGATPIWLNQPLPIYSRSMSQSRI